jgi:hypothetical protein
MSGRIEKFSDLSPSTKLFRVIGKYESVLRNSEKVKKFLARASDLDACYLPSLLILLEDEFLRRDQSSTEKQDEILSLKTELQTSNAKIDALEKRLCALEAKSPSRSMKKSTDSPGFDRFVYLLTKLY